MTHLKHTRARPALAALSLAIGLALGAGPIAAQAQVVGAPGTHAPGIDHAANGTPVVHIVAPTAGGVSHNQYQQYDVDRRGVVLNNAGVVVQSAQAGYIVGNDRIGGGPAAKIILNEVTSNLPSHLRGYTEVAGASAEVVIANANGITCDGCGFINTTRGTLTTGAPVFGGDGSLAAFRVGRGAVTIEGAGFDASNIDRLDIVARTVAANARIWARDLTVVTGANQVRYGDLATEVIQGEGGTNGISLDVAALGGMYANKIRLRGTEAGVGVRNAGELASQAGDFEITSAGLLQLTGKTTSAGDLTVRAGAIDNHGVLAASRGLAIVADSGVTNGGKIYALGGDASLLAGSFDNLASGDLFASGSLWLDGGPLTNAGSIEAGQHLALTTSGMLLQSGKLIASAGDISLSADHLVNAGGISASRDVTIVAGDVEQRGTVAADHDVIYQVATLSHAGRTQAGRDIDLRANRLDQAGVLYAANDIMLRGGDIANANNATVLADGSLRIEMQGMLVNDGTLQAGQHISALMLGTLANTGTGQLFAGGMLQLATRGDAANQGRIFAGGATTLDIGGRFSHAGTLVGENDVTINAHALDASGVLGAGVKADGSLGTRGSLAIYAGNLLRSSGTLVAAQSLTLDGGAIDVAHGNARAGGDMTFTAREGSIDNTGGNIVAGDRLLLNAHASVINASGGFLQGSFFDLLADALDNRNGQLVVTGNTHAVIALRHALINYGGRISANTARLMISAADIDNRTGAIEHAGNGLLSVLATGAIDNGQGRMVGNGALLLRSNGAWNNGAGSVSVAGNAAMFAASLDNRQGSIVADTVSLAIDHAIDNDGGAVQANAQLHARAGSLANGSGQVKAVGAGSLDLDIAGALGNSGFIGGNGALTLSAGDLFNTGQFYSGSDAFFTLAGTLANSGALQAIGNMNLQLGGHLNNRAGRIETGTEGQANTLTVAAASIDNSGGRIANAGNALFQLVTSDLTNYAGTLGGQGALTLNASSVDNTDGTLVAAADMTIAANALINAGGTVYAAGTLRWINSQASLANAWGRFGAGGDMALTLAWLDNASGETTATNDIALELGALNGAGRVIAGRDLAIALPGSYTNVAGNRLMANGHFRFDLGGAFVNDVWAMLESVGDLTVNATTIENRSNARISSSHTSLNSRASLVNQGRLEGDALDIAAVDVDNTGTLVGDVVTVHAANLTNGEDLGSAVDNNPYDNAIIAATQRMALYITGTLLNRDASLYSVGDIVIAADEAGNRSAAIINRSGSIEADGSIHLAAQQITNERRVFDTGTYVLADAERAQNTQTEAPQARYRYDDPNPLHHPPYVDASQVVSAEEIRQADAFCKSGGDDDNRCIGWSNGSGSASIFQQIISDTVLSRTRIDRTSAESRIVASGDITVSGSLKNDKSTIAAANNLVINGVGADALASGVGTLGGERIENIGWLPTATIERSIARMMQFEYLQHDPRRWVAGEFRQYTTAVSSVSVSLGLGAGRPDWITLDEGPVAQARMTAGNALEIHGSDITNGTVDSDGNLIGGIGVGSNAGGTTVSGRGPDGAGPVRGQDGGVGIGAAGPIPGSQTVGPVDAPGGHLQLPGGGLFTRRPEPDGPYLVESDPRFASIAGLLGSDYLMDRLGLSGINTMKRLGDAFYEQRLVLDQITSLTGRRFLSDNSDAMAQYRDLMDSGASAAEKFQLSIGVALTPEQMGQLTEDVVWMVSQNVGGQQVLVPVVYLSAAHAQEIAAGGAILSGKTVLLDANGTVANAGRIDARHDATIKAGTLLNAGALSAGNSLNINAAQDILNAGSIRGGNVALVAGNDIVTGATVGATPLGELGLNLHGAADAARLGLQSGGDITSSGSLTAQAGRDLSIGAAPIKAGGDLGLAAGRDLTATASTISAGGNAQLVAGRDLSLKATGQTAAVREGSTSAELTQHTVSTVTAGGSAVLAAGRDLVSQGAQVKAGDVVAVSAGRDVTLNAVTDTLTQSTSAKSGGKLVSTTTRDEALRGSALDGGAGVVVSAGRDIGATAATITSAAGGITLAAGRDVTLDAGVETHTWEESTRRRGKATTTLQWLTCRDGPVRIWIPVEGSSISQPPRRLSEGMPASWQCALCLAEKINYL